MEEAAQADLILNVCDGSSADAPAQIAVTRQLLGELGAQDIPILTVFNKADRLDIVPESGREGVWISAKNAWGLDKLLDAISQSLPDSQCRCRLLVPYDRAGVLATLRQDGQVFQEEYVPEGISIDIL
ncbi:MAG: GTPase HflX, partial [Oscillospiraceae bacterium]